MCVHSEQLKDNEIFQDIQKQIQENSWIRRVQFSLETNYKVPYRRTKLLVVGDGGAGKSSTIRSLLNYDFDEERHSTEVADANIPVSLFGAVNWRQQHNYADLH